MADVSRVLRAARERSGLSLEEVSARTRIKLTFLQAIERGEFERLPGEFFARAFLRTYARELHLPPDAIVQRYDASRPEVESPGEDDRGAVKTAGHVPVNSPRSDHSLGQNRSFSIERSARTVWPLVAAAVILVAVLVMATRRGPDGSSEVGAVGTAGVEGAEVAPAAYRVAFEPEAEPQRLALEIRPSGTTWVAAAADGEQVVYRLLQPGDHVVVEAREALSIRIGNAAAFAYSINGVPGRALGGDGEVRDVRITRENYRTFGR
jgi:cytoskeleton protein RodZ